MPPRNKRKRPVKTEPPDSDSDCAYTSDDQQAPQKRVKAEVKEEVKVEELSDEDFAIVLSDCELSGSSDRQVGRPVRRSAGGRPPRRGVDVSSLYEEAGVEQLARSLGQVVKEEAMEAAAVSDDAKIEGGSGSPFRVSAYVRRAAAMRTQQILLGDEIDKREALAASEIADIEPRQKRKGRRGYNLFTEEQREFLRSQFEIDPYPDRATKEGLSKRLGVEYMSVQCWFQRARARRGTSSGYDSARIKCKFGPAIYDELVAVFERNPRPDLDTRKALAVKAGASATQVYDWFKTRRADQRDPLQKVEITSALRAELEEVFKANPYPDRETRTMLEEKIGCSMRQVWTWFHHRRQKAGIKRSREEHARRVCPFGPEGYEKLVAQFKSVPYPDMETRVTLAADLGGTIEQVSRWFMSRRVSEGLASRANQARLQCAVGPAAYDELVAAFEVDPFPDRKTREALAAKTGGTLKQITDWFWNRRQMKGIRPRSDALARSKCKFGARVYDELVAKFEADPFPDSATVKALAQKGGGTPQQIRGWFCDRRKRFGIQRSNEERARQTCKFGPEAYDQLVAQYIADPYPSADVIEELAERAGATATQIRTWFQHRRSKHRRQKQK